MSNSSSEAQRVFFLLQNSSKGSIKSQTQTAIILLQLPQKKWSTFISIHTSYVEDLTYKKCTLNETNTALKTGHVCIV